MMKSSESLAQEKPPLVIIGFGNQAKAWALNLRNSGRKIYVSLREQSPNYSLVQDLGFPLLDLANIDFNKFDQFALLTPDHTHEQILQDLSLQYKNKIAATFIYAHGFSVCKNKLPQKFPNWNHLLLAPKAIAQELRFAYETKGKIGAVYGLEYSLSPVKDLDFLLDLAKDLGITVGPYAASFEQETYADLFSEQALLCSVIPYVANLCYQLLVKKGIQPELAYLECWHEIKLIVDTMVKVGPYEFFQMISPNALVGSEKGKNLLLDQHFEQKMQILLQDILEQKFFQELDQVNFENKRKEVLNFWEQQDFHQQFKKMSPLFS